MADWKKTHHNIQSDFISKPEPTYFQLPVYLIEDHIFNIDNPSHLRY